MSRYLSILAVDAPFDIGPDESSRPTFSVNFETVAAAPVTAFEREVAKILSDAGLGTLATDLFIGTPALIPVGGDGPYTLILATGGFPSRETHDGAKYERRSLQVLVRASGYEAANTRALAVWRTLDGKRNVTVVA